MADEKNAVAETAPAKEKTPPLAEQIKPVVEDILNRLDDVHTLFSEVAELFGRVKVQKGVDYFTAQADKVLDMKSWYDPSVKKEAKAARLRSQLERLEKEIAEEEAKRSSGGN